MNQEVIKVDRGIGHMPYTLMESLQLCEMQLFVKSGHIYALASRLHPLTLGCCRPGEYLRVR